MAAITQSLIEMFRLATAGFTECGDILAELPDPRGETARPAVQFAFQNAVTGFTQLEALSRRYLSEAEYAAKTAGKPILSDQGFRSAAGECAASLDAIGAYLGIAGKRIAATLRAWLDQNDPTKACVLHSQCDAAARLAKTKAGRAS
jgi:hypothetical protein